MAEFRYDPMLNDWVIIAAKRQNRPNITSSGCAFCPGSGKVPDGGYDVLRYANDFPSMSISPDGVSLPESGVYNAAQAYGRCEVVLYSDEHNAKLKDMSDEKMLTLAKTWRDIYEEYRVDEKIKYTFIFENRGKEVGVSMLHPHGQVYGYGFMPKRIEEVVKNLRVYKEKHGRCMVCDMLEAEKKEAERIVFSDEYFTVYVPYYSRYPYGVCVVSNTHKGSVAEMEEAELASLGRTVKKTAGMYDNLFGFDFPYMMCMYNAPYRIPEAQQWHFHMEYFPPLRSAETQKYNASSETGCWAHCNPTLPEEKAFELRKAYARYMDSAAKNN